MWFPRVDRLAQIDDRCEDKNIRLIATTLGQHLVLIYDYNSAGEDKIPGSEQKQKEGTYSAWQQYRCSGHSLPSRRFSPVVLP